MPVGVVVEAIGAPVGISVTACVVEYDQSVDGANVASNGAAVGLREGDSVAFGAAD